MNIYVGNLDYQVTSEDLKEAFGNFGEVASVNVIIDRETGRSKGFGFVEMPDDTAAEQAITGLDGTPLLGRNLRVNQAKPREERPARRNRY
ncbi:MAG: RNA-binding protein [Candidatus Stygibacter australis]|nr:RNA-binding protein [Candidatus Stygibacter australis]